jgi:hypothetical protein
MSDTTTEAAAISEMEVPRDPLLDKTETTLASRWTRRVFIILGIGLVLFLWGLYDAAVKYPETGIKAAEYLEFQYLRASQKVGKAGEASVADPLEEIKRLEGRKAQNVLSNEIEKTRLEWLEALKNAHVLNAANTKIDDPQKRYRELEVLWGGASAQPPQPLEPYDLWVQWAITGAGLAVVAWRGLTALPVARRKYYWDTASSTLKLPGGATLVASDIVEFDKRKWDKFFVTLVIRDGHPEFSGQRKTYDMYPYNELESWILELEAQHVKAAGTAAA